MTFDFISLGSVLVASFSGWVLLRFVLSAYGQDRVRAHAVTGGLEQVMPRPAGRRRITFRRRSLAAV